MVQQNRLRLIRESDGDQLTTQLMEASVQQALGVVVSEVGAFDGTELYFKVAVRVARVDV